jgi:fimbrial chaperone protein
MKSMIFVIAIAVAVQLAGESASAAYQFQPISRVFSPTGSKATQSFEVVNSGANRVAVTVSFATLERDEQYVETNRDAEDEFLAYPAQMILEPGARQTLRVTWLGTPKPTRELAYRIIVTQVPIERIDRTKVDDRVKGQVQIMLTYRGTLFIRPPKAAPRVVLGAAALETGADGRPALAFMLENTGTAVGLVKTCAVRLAPAAAGPGISLPPAALAVVQNTRVLGGGKRRYVLPWPAGVTPGPVKATGQCSVEP